MSVVCFAGKRKVSKPQDRENVLFRQWQLAPPHEKEKCLAALQHLLVRHAEIVVWNWLRRNDWDLANEMASNLMQTLGRFHGLKGCQFSSWAHKCFQNRCRDEKRRKRYAEESLDVPHNAIVFEPRCWPDMDKRIYCQQLLAMLSERDARIVIARAEGETLIEIGKIEGLLGMTVFRRFQKAVTFLRAVA